MCLYRTHNCGELRESDVGKIVKLSGWVHKKRDHGSLLFIDLRDHYGITQCVIDSENKVFPEVEKIRHECIVTIKGTVVKRDDSTINKENPTGMVEIKIAEFTVLSYVASTPFAISSISDLSEENRLKYRFLDLRREKLHKNIVLRSNIISSIHKLYYKTINISSMY